MLQPKNKEAVVENYGPENLDDALVLFKKAYPTYELTAKLDRLRQHEYARLDKTNQIYLDYTGGGLHAESQLRQHMALLSEQVFGNPHSNNPTSVAMTHLVEKARAYVLEYFNASPDTYTVIFTPNASGALKHVGESYPFGPGGQYLLTFDNHNSVNGIREFACSKGADVNYIPLTTPDLRIDLAVLQELLAQSEPGQNNLFAFPAQSNYSGVQHPLELIEVAHDNGWDVLVDCAAFAPTNRLDIDKWQPDYVALSFYKMFGYPTGIGCLLARKTALSKLQRPWFAGGTIVFASVQGQKHNLAKGEAAFEDGTVDYLNIPAVEVGLKYIESVGIKTIHDRVTCLTGWLIDNLMALHHDNGKPMVRIYGPTELHMRGGTVTFNLYDPAGKLFDYRRIEELAGKVNISLRTGCFCNPGAGEISEGLNEAEMVQGFQEAQSFPQFIAKLEHSAGKSAGAVRISVGLATNFNDVYGFMAFVHGFLNKESNKIGKIEFDIESCRVIRDGS